MGRLDSNEAVFVRTSTINKSFLFSLFLIRRGARPNCVL